MNISGSSSADITALMREKMQQRFSKADQDSSGGLDLSEFHSLGQTIPGAASASIAGSTANNAAQAMFSKLDTDSDGSLTATEMEAGRPPGPPPGAGGLSSDMMSALLSGQDNTDSTATAGTTDSSADARDALLSSLDIDGNGTLNSGDFATFKSENKDRPPPQDDDMFSALFSQYEDSDTASSQTDAMMQRLMSTFSQVLGARTADTQHAVGLASVSLSA